MATEPMTMTYDEVNLAFPSSGRSFTGLIKTCWDYPITENGVITRKRYGLSLFERYDVSCCNRMTCYLYDEWSDIMAHFWNNIPYKSRKHDNIQLSITFFAVRVKKIDDGDDMQQKKLGFIVDTDTPNNAWIELKTCCNRICGRKGIRLCKNDVLNHLNGTKKIEIDNNVNIKYLTPKYPYLPLSQLIPTKNSNGFLYGYVTMWQETKQCKGKHNYFKQIRIRDSSLSWDSDDLTIMFFGNNVNEFPECKESDIIRIHRMDINYRQERNAFQGVVRLDQKSIGLIVFNGDNTNQNYKDSVKYSFSNKFSFDELVDGYFVKYLKESCRLRFEQTNPDLVNIKDKEIPEMKNEVAVSKVNHMSFKLLSQIEETDGRLNILVMINARLDIAEEKKDDNMDIDNDVFTFYWIIWDGSRCKRQGNTENEMSVDGVEVRKWECNNSYNNNPQIMGSLMKILVSPPCEIAVQCYQDIYVGQWVELINVLYDKTKNELIYDEYSELSTSVDIKTNEDLQKRLDLCYYSIYKQTNVISTVSKVIRHHQYQSYSVIRAILDIKQIGCKFKIRGKCTGHYPPDVKDFTKNNKGLQFGLDIEDASGSKIKVLVFGKEARLFFGIKKVGDLTKNKEQLIMIKRCMDFMMRESSNMELCIKSYKRKNRLLYQIIDTVLNI